MSFRGDLGEKLTDLRAAAETAESAYLQLGEDEDGNLTTPDGQRVPDGDGRVGHRAAMRSLLDDVVARFESFYDLGVGRLKEISATLGGLDLGFEALTPGSTVFNGIRLADHEMDDVRSLFVKDDWNAADVRDGSWHGNAAEQFSSRFVDQFQTASEWQRAYVQELNAVVGTLLTWVYETREDIKTIADLAVVAIRGTDLDSGYAFGVAATAFTAIGLSLEPEIFGTLSLASDFTARFIELLSDREPEERKWSVEMPEPDPTGFRDPIPILNAVRDTIDRLDRGTGTRDESYREMLRQDLEDPNGFDSPLLNIRRPEIADDPTVLGASIIPHDPAPGTPQSQDGLVVSLANLYEAGRVKLPAVSDHVRRAGEKLGDCDLPQFVQKYLPRTVPKYDSALGHLAGILRHFSDDVDDAGTNLTTVATIYALTDGESQDRIQRINQIDSSLHPLAGQHDPDSGLMPA